MTQTSSGWPLTLKSAEACEPFRADYSPPLLPWSWQAALFSKRAFGAARSVNHTSTVGVLFKDCALHRPGRGVGRTGREEAHHVEVLMAIVIPKQKGERVGVRLRHPALHVEGRFGTDFRPLSLLAWPTGCS